MTLGGECGSFFHGEGEPVELKCARFFLSAIRAAMSWIYRMHTTRGLGLEDMVGSIHQVPQDSVLVGHLGRMQSLILQG